MVVPWENIYGRYRTKTLSCPGSREYLGPRSTGDRRQEKKRGKMEVERKACLPGVLGNLGLEIGMKCGSVASRWFPSWSWYFLGPSLAGLQTLFFRLLLHYRPFLYSTQYLFRSAGILHFPVPGWAAIVTVRVLVT